MVRFRRTAAISALVVFLFSGGAARARVITVPGEYPTIQAGIDAAGDHDEVRVSPGLYHEEIDFKGKNIVVRSTSTFDPAATVIAGTGGGPTVVFAGTETPSCRLEGFTITSGTMRSPYYWAAGIGGLGTSATIVGNTITANDGFGIHDVDGLIDGNTISASTLGGLSSCDGVIRYNIVRDNQTGGGLYECQAHIRHNTISGNNINGTYLAVGGGLSGCGGTIEGNFITSNTAVSSHHGTAEGAGLYNCNGTIKNNVIAWNVANGWNGSLGAGIGSCSGIVVNNTVFGNRATGYLANNRYAGLSGSPALLANCIFGSNRPSGGSPVDVAATPTYCVIQDWTVWGDTNFDQDPRFVDPFNSDFRLLPDSPCIDAGQAVAGVTEDFQGDPRPIDAVAEPRGDGSNFDIGVDEFVPTPAPARLRWRKYR